MPDDLVKYDYAQLEAMAAELQKGAQRLEETKDRLVKAVQIMQQGAFQGQAGEYLANALVNDLVRSIEILEQYYRQMAEHIQQAAQDMLEAEAKAKF